VVLQTAILMLGISLISTVLAVLNSNFSIRVGESVARDIREAIFVKVQKFSYGDLDHFSTGKLMVRLTSDTSAVQRITQVSLRIGTRAPLLMIGSIILMFVTSKTLALTMIPLLLVTGVVIVFFSVKMEPMFRAVQQRLDRLNTVLQENISGASLVKSFVRADYEGDRFETANEDLTHNTINVMQLMSAMSPALTVFINIGMKNSLFPASDSISGSFDLTGTSSFAGVLAGYHWKRMDLFLDGGWEHTSLTASGKMTFAKLNETITPKFTLIGRNNLHVGLNMAFNLGWTPVFSGSVGNLMGTSATLLAYKYSRD